MLQYCYVNCCFSTKVRFIMNMKTKNVIEKIKDAVHKPINFDDFKSSCTCENTNSYALAIGSTVTANRTLYRPGRLSGKKPLAQDFSSVEEVKDLFFSDLEFLDLKYESLDLVGKKEIFDYASQLKLKENEHLLVMFVQEFADHSIGDYKFLRYDPNIGWSEKRGCHQFLTGKNVSWPSNWYDKFVGCFKITR